MATANKDLIFSQYGYNISYNKIKKNTPIPFREHDKFHLIVDILSRKASHHAILSADFPAHLHVYFLTALGLHLNQDIIPHTLRGADLIYLDVKNLLLMKNNSKAVEQDFQSFSQTLDTCEKCTLLVLSDLRLLQTNQQGSELKLLPALDILLAHPKCRVMAFLDSQNEHISADVDPSFDYVRVEGPSAADITAILKMERAELENYHHVVIPEELPGYAYSLAERYLSTTHTLEKTLLLLDSSAARAAITERPDSNPPLKPVMTMLTLTQVLSGWTRIPAGHLQLHKFKYSDFIQGMQQNVFGQDAAIALLGHELQQSLARLQQHSGPFCSLLFAGSEHSGKHTAAVALANQLFRQPNVLYIAQPCASGLSSIMELKLQKYTDKTSLKLKDLVRQTPYAIVLYENIDAASPVTLDGLQEILGTGRFQDTNGQTYNFSQTIIILTTVLGTNLLNEIAKTFAPEPESNDMDLLQLVMREQKHETLTSHHYSPQEIADTVRCSIASYLPASLCQYLHVIPFLPLSDASIEQIMRLKLKELGKTLDIRYGVELGYAPEITRYLVNELQKKVSADNQPADIDAVLKQLYFAVEQAVLSQADNKNRPNQLFLQLNETGEIMRCDWLSTAPARQHAT
ncbi:ATP-dependent Clp protease ATP-binding subunit ClpE [Aquicella siphonis]|uniref:ATP-dependent Clp protease ATP-binding subunit ClpE n=1 Tax=Aquicella siphonis TaxID=254247 RepID=A0A5E4PIQ3_9COXI|nr:AAA family ATPase [Aquicella siphonis]VVC76824.1 ATP-dependent Clp protease ATP-binding subunit ClpE [Aquicella siphonis]